MARDGRPNWARSVLYGRVQRRAREHLLIYSTEHDARQHCHDDTIVWANTRTHAQYLPSDKIHHTHGGYACESKARTWLSGTEDSRLTLCPEWRCRSALERRAVYESKTKRLLHSPQSA
jgi:hypothetical protein